MPEPIPGYERKVPYLGDPPATSASTSSAEQDPNLVQEPLGLLRCWLDEIADAGAQSHTAMTLCNRFGRWRAVCQNR